MRIQSNLTQLSVGSINTPRTIQNQQDRLQPDPNTIEKYERKKIVVTDSLSTSLKDLIKKSKEEEEEKEEPKTSIERTIDKLEKQIEKVNEQLEKLKNDKSEAGEKRREQLSQQLNVLNGALMDANKEKIKQEKSEAQAKKQ